jgi:hypothetical protein
LISRTVHGTLPNDRDNRNAVLRKDAEYGASVKDEQRTKAYHSQDYAKKFPGVGTMANHDLLRDVSKRFAASKASVDIYRSMPPGQGGKSFAQLCRDIAINQSGYAPKADMDSYRGEKKATMAIQLLDQDMDSFTDSDRVIKRIEDDVAPKVEADEAFQNAKRNTPGAAKIEHDKALAQVMLELLKDDTKYISNSYRSTLSSGSSQIWSIRCQWSNSCAGFVWGTNPAGLHRQIWRGCHGARSYRISTQRILLNVMSAFCRSIEPSGKSGRALVIQPDGIMSSAAFYKVMRSPSELAVGS